MRKIILLIILVASYSFVDAQNNQRALSASELSFIKNVQERLQQLFSKTASAMKGNWIIKFTGDPDMNKPVELSLHNGRPHELTCNFSMEYKPTDLERKEMDHEIAFFYNKIGKRQPTASERINDPSYKFSINIIARVNNPLTQPVDVLKATALGGTANFPGAVFSIYRTENLNTGAPYFTLYLGEFKKTTTDGREMIMEGFTETPLCTKVRTIELEVHSNLPLAREFISKLDLAALNRLIRDN